MRYIKSIVKQDVDKTFFVSKEAFDHFFSEKPLEWLDKAIYQRFELPWTSATLITARWVMHKRCVLIGRYGWWGKRS
jgi:hypothetical protein